MKAIVHIGTEKTGTTTIQECLLLNQEFLKQRGFGILTSPGRGNNRKLATFCMNDDHVDDHIVSLGLKDLQKRNASKIEFKNDLKSEIENIGNDIHTVIISSEHFHSRLVREKEVTRLSHLLSEFFNKIEIVLYLRRQDLMANSLYSTACRVGFSDKNIFPEKISEQNRYYNFELLIEKWAKIFGAENINAQIFEKEKLIDNDLLSDFFARIGLGKYIMQIERPKNQNESISWQTQLVLLSFNKIFFHGDKKNKNPEHDLLRRKIWQRINLEFPGKGLMPARDEAIRFYEKFEQSNNRMSEKWFDNKQRFSTDFTMYPEENEKLMLQPEILDVVFEIIKDCVYLYH